MLKSLTDMVVIADCTPDWMHAQKVSNAGRGLWLNVEITPRGNRWSITSGNGHPLNIDHIAAAQIINQLNEAN